MSFRELYAHILTCAFYLRDLKCSFCLHGLKNGEHLLHMIQTVLIDILIFLTRGERLQH